MMIIGESNSIQIRRHNKQTLVVVVYVVVKKKAREEENKRQRQRQRKTKPRTSPFAVDAAHPIIYLCKNKPNALE
jgi:hypothetical protein